MVYQCYTCKKFMGYLKDDACCIYCGTAWELSESKRRDNERLELELHENERLESECRKNILHEKIELDRLNKQVPFRLKLNELRLNNYLAGNTFYNESCKEFINASEYERDNTTFVKNWLSKHISPAKGGKVQLPDDEQATAICEVWKNTQVIARAGSGKTSTLVNRAFFLQKHCGVAPSEMLLLAFNRKAAIEIAERLENLCGNSASYVMTFHALARAIVHPTQELIYNNSAEENQGLDSVFGDVIKDRIEESDFLARVRKLMLAQFKQDWEELVEGGYDLTPDELYRFQKNLARETLRGEYVKSHGEKVIANFLFEHNIPYNYEKAHYKQGTVLRPDFTLPPVTEGSKNIIIEYFGMAGSNPEYDRQMEEKREYWGNSGKYEFIELVKDDFASGESTFEEILKKKLENLCGICSRLSDDEIWLQIKPRAIKRFSSAMSGFVGRCRKAWILHDDLGRMISEHKPFFDAESWFLELAVIVYTDYLERLKEDNKQDFDGLMQAAASVVASGGTTFDRRNESGDLAKLRYIFIDEYQDFSELFHRLIEAVRLHNPEVTFFCVGDDWQAINGFAGSDLKFYENFSSYFPASKQLYISTNYRSVSSVVTVGNALMAGRGKLATASKKAEGLVRIVNLSSFTPTLIEEEKFTKGPLTPVILRLAGKALKEKKSVLLLSRRNVMYSPDGLPVSIYEYLEKYLYKLLPAEWRKSISISTVNKIKGGEADVVIIMDALERNYPLIHPNWIFSRILGENLQQIDDENRRLFYVALTRAKESLFIVTENDKASSYLADIARSIIIPEIDWDKYPPVTPETDTLIVRISGRQFFALTDDLNADGFQFRRYKGKAIRDKKFKRQGFVIERLQKTSWALKALSEPETNFEVTAMDGMNAVVESYNVAAGKWTKRVEPMVSLVDTSVLVAKAVPPLEKESQEDLSLPEYFGPSFEDDDCPF